MKREGMKFLSVVAKVFLLYIWPAEKPVSSYVLNQQSKKVECGRHTCISRPRIIIIDFCLIGTNGFI